MRRLSVFAIGLVLVCLAAPVAAQTPQILTPANFLMVGASPDHAAVFAGVPVVSGYQVEFYLPSQVTAGVLNAGAAPAITVPLAKPTPDATNSISTPPLIPMIQPGVLYDAVIAAVGPGGVGRSNVVGPFGFPKVPASPGPATLK